ncbi:MAG: SIS domain-containing protein [Nitrospirota bacterium]
MREKILKAFQDSVKVKERFVQENLEAIAEAARLIADTFNKGGKLFLFGNGGSSTDASHITAEFVGRFKKERPGLPAISLNTDMATITCVANDYDYSEVFARQLKALSSEGDVVIALSTSGGSPNVLKRKSFPPLLNVSAMSLAASAMAPRTRPVPDGRGDPL